MVLHNPNNWHWVDKNCVEWSKNYFTDNYVGIKADSDDKATHAKITKLSSLTGDVDVSQRKGKVITLFDMKLVFDFSGSAPEADKVDGTITIPEVAYDTEKDEYVFDINIQNEERAKEPVKELVRSKIVPQLREKLSEFGHDLLAENAKDIQHPVDQVKSTYTLSNAKESEAAIKQAKASKASSSSSSVPGAKYNTTQLNLEPVFNTSAAELYQTFIDPQRVAAWTRSPPHPFDPKIGGEYALFGGNVQGRFLKLEPGKIIEMSWRLKDWKEGHYADMVLEFCQGAGETKIKVHWTGIPIGQEDVTRGNFEEYYVKSIKLTFGFGAVL